MPWGRIKRDQMPRLACLVREPLFIYLFFLLFIEGVFLYQIERRRSEHLGLAGFEHSEGIFFLAGEY